MSSKDYELIFKVKNAKLLHLMRLNGHKTIRDLSRVSGISYQQIVNVSNLKVSAYKKDFTLRTIAKRLIDYFRCEPFDIFPEEVMYEALKKNQSSLEFTSEELNSFMPSIGFDIKNLEEEINNKQLIKELAEHWSTRETRIMINHFWDGATLEEIAKAEGVTRNRIAQIVNKAKRKSVSTANYKGLNNN